MAQTTTGPLGEQFTRRVLAEKLSDPWEVTYGPDNFLWITEARGYRVSRLNPATGARQVVLDLSKNREFPRYDKIPDSVDGGKPWPQGGLMGLALHPQLLTGKPYVYLSYIYRYAGADQPGNGSAPNYGGHFFTARLVRYEYDARAQTLSRPLVLCDTIPASNDHNAGRLLIAPVAGRDYLFYSVGDLGAGQFENGGRPNHAQSPLPTRAKCCASTLSPTPTTPPPTSGFRMTTPSIPASKAPSGAWATATPRGWPTPWWAARGGCTPRSTEHFRMMKST
ncbi:PQQ-dependent sugar dehydrogenase [Hymenobacter sp. 5516J-16]|uniref:PQQ-dependent sugar dehydrogenase n=1 Tax=Hymenobacter sp. 5516J-16 TaxID=2932253 RepID=UPI001FD0DE33|nr:PQQ-dependent sugar dehydrogenase [Hymenobacter sp. 5516J-16]